MWITLTAADFASKIAEAEYASVLSTQLPDGKTGADVLAEELVLTTNEVRGYVSAQIGAVLGAGVTLPEELADTALVIVRHKVFTRLPGLKRLLDEGRVREWEQALARLKEVARNLFKVAAPATPATEQPGGQGISVVGGRPARQHTREKWSGTL